MRNKAALVFHSSNHVLVPCEFGRTGPGVSEAELLECPHHEAAAPSSGVHLARGSFTMS